MAGVDFDDKTPPAQHDLFLLPHDGMTQSRKVPESYILPMRLSEQLICISTEVDKDS